MDRVFITWQNSQKKTQKKKNQKKRNNFNYVQLHKINKLYTTNYIQRCMRKKRKKKRKYTIECVFTSHSESCVAYLLIDERTGPIGTMQKLQIITNTEINIVTIYKYI